MPTPKNEPAQRLKAHKDKDTGEGPLRQCAVTRESLPQQDMIRFVRSPDGVALPDASAKLPGRGAWVTAKRDVVEQAISKGAFSRAFKTKTEAGPDTLSLIEQQLVHRCIGLLGMARKAGEAILGFDQVRDYLRKDAPGYLLEAADGSEDGRNKVHFLAKALYETPRVAGALTSAELGMAFGRPRVIHGLLQDGALSDSFDTAYRRLTGFRAAPERDWFSGRNR